MSGSALSGIAFAFVWFAAISLGLVALAAIERRARVPQADERPGFGPRRAPWGGGLEHPPSRSMLARALAGGARLVRSRTRVSDRATGLRVSARAVACFALASGLALVPFGAGIPGPYAGRALVVADLHHGLVALILFASLAALAEVAIGLSDSSVFARLACVRLAGRVLASMATLALVCAPIALAAGSLRLHVIALAQQGPFRPLEALWRLFGAHPTGPLEPLVGLVRLPAWFVFRQPITALLFVVVMGLLTRRPLALDALGGSVRLSAFGHDDDPGELYWSRTAERLAALLFAALFVALFLGGGALPLVPTSTLVAPLAPFFGEGLPAIVAGAIELGVFLTKWVVVLVLVARVAGAMPALRDDQWIRLVTRRWMPLAWANLLLVAAVALASGALREGGA
ncbi:MAG: NADH-quinone oxidoreductase subunit H [Myxococcota bacterium]